MKLKQLSSSSLSADKQTRLLVAAGLLVALIVFFVYTKPHLSSRDKATSDYKVQLDILEKEKANAAKFLTPGAERDQYIAAVKDADGFFPYLDPNAPDLQLALPGIVQTAAASAGLKLDAIPTGTLLDALPGSPAGVSAFEMTISIDATPKQVDDFIAALTESKRVRATVPGITMQAKAPQVEGQKADLRDPAAVSFQITIRLWYTTLPPLSASSTTTTVPASSPTASSTPPAPSSSAP